MTPSVTASPPAIRHQSEAAFQRAVIEYAQLNGWAVYHTHFSRHSQAGYPDLTLVRGRRLVFAELKTATGRMSAEQQQWLNRLALTGVETFLWRPADWPVIERELGRDLASERAA